MSKEEKREASQAVERRIKLEIQARMLSFLSKLTEEK